VIAPGRPLQGLLALACAGVVAFAPPAHAQRDSTSGPPVPDAVGFVNDNAGIVPEAERAELESFLDQVKRKTGVEFAVLTMRTTAPATPSEYKTRVFDQWKLGKKGEDTGLLMLVALEEREARFETGYGLEGILPDGLQSRIFREEMAPRFRDGDYGGGIRAGVIAVSMIIAKDRGVTLEWNGQQLRYGEGAPSRSTGGIPTSLIIAIIILIVIFRILRGPRRRGGWWYTGGGGWGGWGGGFGGGGWGGGGGGGGFGGFGGGSSGGGGGGGKW
jgi:uncharacterized protein